MILDIFLPEKIGNYYVLPKRIIGLDIEKNALYATQIMVRGRSVQLEKFLTENLDTTITDYTERVQESIKKLLQQCDKFDVMRSSLHSSSVIFKELTLPFIDASKISMVLRYELESSLPFPIDEAIIDFIITKRDPATKQSTILVAAVQKNHVLDQLHYFTNTGTLPNAITVDLFDLYGLYLTIPAYAALTGGIVLLDIGYYTTRIAYIINGQLKLIRTLPRGITHIAKIAGQKLGIGNGELFESLIRFGLEKNNDPNYNKFVSEAFSELWQEIQFTFQSFLNQLGTDYSIDRILLLGEAAEIAGLESFIAKNTEIPSSLFDVSQVIQNRSINIKNGTIPRTHCISLGTAMVTEITENFNLLKEEFVPSKITQFSKNFFTALGLALFFTLSLLLYSWWQTSKLYKAVRSSEQDVVVALRNRDLTDARDLKRSIDDAKEKVDREEELWFAFSRQTRFSFLKALQDLSTTIDRKSIGLNLKKMTLTENAAILEGEVKGFEELKILERELRESNLFVSVPTLQTLKFSERLIFKKSGELGS